MSGYNLPHTHADRGHALSARDDVLRERGLGDRVVDDPAFGHIAGKRVRVSGAWRASVATDLGRWKSEKSTMLGLVTRGCSADEGVVV